MNQSILPQILLQAVLIGLNAIFACAEIAVISFNDAKLAAMAAAGDKRAIRLAHLTSQPARFLATIQVAITLSGFLGAAFGADNFAGGLTEAILSVAPMLPRDAVSTASVVLVTLILSYFTLIFGELVPKRLAMKKTEELALGISGLVSFISVVCKPIVAFLTFSTNLVLRLCGVDPNAEDEEVSEEDIRIQVDAGAQKGVIDRREQRMIENVFDFDDIPIGRFTTHRTEAAILWEEDTPADWEETMQRTRHSIYLVCGRTADEVLGTLSIKDYYVSKDKSHDFVLHNLLKPAVFVPESLRASQLFTRMQQSRVHFAVVLDEYGGTLGIVTMNDLLQQIVGPLENEDVQHAPDEITPLSENSWRVLGTTSLTDVERTLGFGLHAEDCDTMSGYILALCGSIPEDGSSFALSTDALDIQVENTAEHRVESCIITLRHPAVPHAEDIESDL